MSDRVGGWMETFTGRQFWPCDPRPEDVCIEDIAHGLSNTARFGGMTSRFYSVAQHCYIVSQIVAARSYRETALWGLLHDAAEAYIGDMPRPIKHGPGMEAFREMEESIMAVIVEALGLKPKQPEIVKEADAIALCTERRDLMAPIVVTDANWAHGAALAKPMPYTIEPWPPDIAKHKFISRYEYLAGKVVAV